MIEGRDIGSVVFPDTPYKFYIDASLRCVFNVAPHKGSATKSPCATAMMFHVPFRHW